MTIKLNNSTNKDSITNESIPGANEIPKNQIKEKGKESRRVTTCVC